MSESEAGVTSVGEQKSSEQAQAQAQAVVPNMRLTFSPDGTAVYRPVTSATSPTLSSYAPAAEGSVAGSWPAVVPSMGGTMSGNESDQVKRKRGRPRKYGPDGNKALAIIPSPPSHSSGGGSGVSPPPPPPVAPPPPPPPAATPSPPPRTPSSGGKARGRPTVFSKNLQLEALGI